MSICWTCPLCNQSLSIDGANANAAAGGSFESVSKQGNRLSCMNNHSFDIAKQGYVNLLPVQNKGSKNPGDSKDMVRARTDFLTEGHYLPLAETLSDVIKQLISTDKNLNSGLDIGAGEGYFSNSIVQTNTVLKDHWYLLDISKEAIKSAAKKFVRAHSAVASVFSIPLKQQSVDFVVQAFAPASVDEVNKVLKDSGYWLQVFPGMTHLKELRAAIYPKAIEHEPWPVPNGYKEVQLIPVNFTMHLTTAAARANLLSMTPMVWKCSEQSRLDWQNQGCENVQADFLIRVCQRDS